VAQLHIIEIGLSGEAKKTEFLQELEGVEDVKEEAGTVEGGEQVEENA